MQQACCAQAASIDLAVYTLHVVNATMAHVSPTTAGDLRAADRPEGEAGGGLIGGRSSGGAQSSSSTGRAAAQREEAVRRTMQVYLTAWMLSPEVDEGRVEGHLAQLEADMRGF